jgi:hypothetical protein
MAAKCGEIGVMSGVSMASAENVYQPMKIIWRHQLIGSA